MRIGIDAHMLGDRSGGNESFYSNILKQMQFAADDEVFLFVKKGIDVSAYEDRFQIVALESHSPWMRYFVELPRLCKKYQLDLLHTQYFVPFWRPCPVVCTIHDICFEYYKDIFTRQEYTYQKLLIPYAAKHSKLVFTVSANSKKDIITHYGLPEDRVVVTHNSVSDDFCRLTPEELDEAELREKFGIGSGKFIVTVGNLQPRKNLPRLIRAYLQLKKRFDGELKLVIVGKKAWMYDDILKEASKDSEGIILTDYVETRDLIRLYNAASCFVYPSFFEGFGIPPLEAMACGTPVAVANTTSLPEIVGEAGIYFDPFSEEDIENCLERLLMDEALVKELKVKMNDQVKKFSWKESAAKIVESYRTLSE